MTPINAAVRKDIHPDHDLDARNEPRDTGSVALRFVTALIGAIYAAALLSTYRELSKVWSYLGFWYQPVPISVDLLTITASAALGLLLPVREWTIVGFTKWILYFILFIPSLTIPPQQGVLLTDDLLLIEALVWGSAAALIALLGNGRPFPEIRLSSKVLWQGVIGCWVLGNIAIYTVFGDSMSLAGLDQVYEQRAAAASVGGALIGYVMGLMSGAINPFLLVVGLSRRRPLLIGLAVAGQIIIYATLAGKVVLGSTLLMAGTFFVFQNGRVIFLRVYAGILTLAVLGPFVSAPRAASGDLISAISDLIYFRIIALPGVLVGVYSSFFAQYPVTYLSHSLLGRPFSTYPYGAESVGQIIGRYVTPSMGGTNNYNASFIAADGIAGFGTWGIPLIFALAALWLWFMSKLVGDKDRAVACAMLTPFVVSLADASLFTAILTGGGAAAALLLYLLRSAESTMANAPGGRADLAFEQID